MAMVTRSDMGVDFLQLNRGILRHGRAREDDAGRSKSERHLTTRFDDAVGSDDTLAETVGGLISVSNADTKVRAERVSGSPIQPTTELKHRMAKVTIGEVPAAVRRNRQPLGDDDRPAHVNARSDRKGCIVGSEADLEPTAPLRSETELHVRQHERA